jgi:hypothetical protein
VSRIILISIACFLFCKNVSAQETKPLIRCATPTPPHEWDEWFNARVEEYKKTLPYGKATSAATYTIPIIFHIIYSNGEAVGTGHNISQAQVNSQIPILNADYAGIGFNSSQYVYPGFTLAGHPPFYDYAIANSLPAPDTNGVIMAASGITFCLATKDTLGNILPEPGIDRHTWQSISGATNPAAASSPNALMTLFDSKIKPATIWNATKYMNVWISDGGTSGALGYAMFPGGTGMSGIGTSGTATNDGVWVAFNALGNIGAAAAPYNKGRTLTHESGHYFGLRHIWGDGFGCVTDYCNDTPPAHSANFVAWPTAYPYNMGTCSGSPNNSIDGEMFMNFMDYSDDDAMWMFTTDQVTRFHTALTLSPNRKNLTTSAATLCSITVSTLTAAFNPPATVCTSKANVFTDISSGFPTAWNWSVVPSAGVSIANSLVANPAITFPSIGTYVVTDSVFNSAGNSAISQTVTVTNCTVTTCDTISNITSNDTCVIYKVSNGYLSGSAKLTTTTTATYANQALGELYQKASFPTNPIALAGATILFYKNDTIGTKGTSVLTLSMLDNSGGYPGTAVSATQTLSLSSVTTTTPVSSVDFAGTQSVSSGPYMLPYTVIFPTAVPITNDFFLTLSLPTNSDTAVVYSGVADHNALNTSFVKLKPNTSSTSYWYNAEGYFFHRYSFAIIPIVCASYAGIENNQSGNNIVMYPNPGNGYLNFAVALKESTTLNFTVVNTLGEIVSKKTEPNVMNAVIAYDLSFLAKGVYFVSITDSKSNKTIKKIIID